MRPVAVGPPAALGASTAPRLRWRRTFFGGWLFLIGLSVWLSSSSRTRIDVSGMSVHPYLLLLLPLIFVLPPGSFLRIPRSQRLALVAFFGLQLLVTLRIGFDGSFVVKPLVFLLTLWVIAAAVRTEGDFRAGLAGYLLAVASLALVFVAQGDFGSSAVPFAEVGNKNSFALYSCPAVLLAGFVLLERRAEVGRWMKALCGGSLLVVSIATFSSGNRAGWIALVLIGLMLAFRRRRPADLLAIGAIALVAVYLFLSFGSIETFEQRFDRDANSVQSDEHRIGYFTTAIDLGLSNPLLGVGPQRVAPLIGAEYGYLARSPHNLVGQLVAGGGIPLITAFVVLLVVLWRRPSEWRGSPPTADEQGARHLLRMMLVLLFYLGFTNQEVLTTPGFAFGLGLALGLVAVRGPVGRLRPLPRRRPAAGRPATAEGG